MPAKYAHMKQDEAVLWDRYIAQYGLPEGQVDYDVRLGDGAVADPEWPEWMKVMVKALSTKRVDVVSETRFGMTVWEIKRRAGLSAVGQLLGYEALLYKERGGWKPIDLVCVCESIEPDMASVFAYYKVRVVELGE